MATLLKQILLKIMQLIPAYKIVNFWVFYIFVKQTRILISANIQRKKAFLNRLLHQNKLLIILKC